MGLSLGACVLQLLPLARGAKCIPPGLALQPEAKPRNYSAALRDQWASIVLTVRRPVVEKLSQLLAAGLAGPSTGGR